MPCSVEFTKHALRQLTKLPKDARRRIIEAAESLERDPYPAGAVSMTGMVHCGRIRAGDFRVVYQVRGDELVVLVITVGDRKEIYKKLAASLPSIIAAWEVCRK